MKKGDDVTAAEGNEFVDAWIKEFEDEKRRISRLTSMGGAPETSHLSDLTQDLKM